MDHLQESGASIHHRRGRRRAAISLTLVAMLMLGTFAYAAAYFQGWVGTRSPKPSASATCQDVTPAKALVPRAVTVNVYNATDRSGLAATVAKSVRTEGFKVAEVANDPLGRPVTGIAEIRYGRAGTTAAALVRKWFSGAKLVRDNRTGARVDVVLGDTFRALSVPPKVAPPKVVPVKVVPGQKPTPSPSSSC